MEYGIINGLKWKGTRLKHVGESSKQPIDNVFHNLFQYSLIMVNLKIKIGEMLKLCADGQWEE